MRSSLLFVVALQLSCAAAAEDLFSLSSFRRKIQVDDGTMNDTTVAPTPEVCYYVELVSQNFNRTSPPDIGFVCETSNAKWRYYKDPETFLVVEAHVALGCDANFTTPYAPTCSISVNGTRCDCRYEYHTITLGACHLPPEAQDLFPFLPKEQEMEWINPDLEEERNGHQNSFQLAPGAYCNKGGPLPPTPWLVSEECSLPFPPHPLNARNPPGDCFSTAWGGNCETKSSNGCEENNYLLSYFNYPNGTTPGAQYAMVNVTERKGCGGRGADANNRECTVEVESPFLASGPKKNKCKSCKMSADGDRFAELDCSNLPGGIELVSGTYGRLSLVPKNFMCNHPAALEAAKFYEFCGEKSSDGTIEDLETQCYAVDKKQCTQGTESSSGCLRLMRDYIYYNKNNSVTVEEYGTVSVDLAFLCPNRADNTCSISVNGYMCNACTNVRSNVTSLDCSNVPESSTLQLEDQSFSVYNYTHLPKIENTLDMCEHPANQGQLACVNGTASSGYAPDSTSGILQEGKCYARDLVSVSAVDCDGCTRGTYEYRYYNAKNASILANFPWDYTFDDVDMYAEFRVQLFSECYVGQECKVTIGEVECRSCVSLPLGGIASIDCSNVPANAMTGSLSVENGEVVYTGTDEMCEHPSVIAQTLNSTDKEDTESITPGLRSGGGYGSVDDRVGETKEKQLKTSTWIIPSSLHFFMHPGQGHELTGASATALVAATLEYMNTVFLEDPYYKEYFDSVQVQEVDLEYTSDAPDELVVSFDIVVDLSTKADVTEVDVANLIAGANWNLFLANYAKKHGMKEAGKVVYRAVLRNES